MGPWFRILAAAVAVVILGAGCRPVDRLRARLQLKEGNHSYLRGDYRQAVAHYDRALAYVPTLARAHLNRAYSRVALFRASDDVAERRQLVDEATASFQRYLEIIEKDSPQGTDPGRERIEQHMLTLYLDSGQPEKAAALLQERLQRNPRDVASLQMLANLATERGDLEQALHWHRQRLGIESDLPEAHYALGVLAWQFSYYNRVAEERRMVLLDEGLRAVLRAVELRPDYFEALVYANLLYREKAKYAESPELRAEHEAQYKAYEERARQVREAAKQS